MGGLPGGVGQGTWGLCPGNMHCSISNKGHHQVAWTESEASEQNAPLTVVSRGPSTPQDALLHVILGVPRGRLPPPPGLRGSASPPGLAMWPLTAVSWLDVLLPRQPRSGPHTQCGSLPQTQGLSPAWLHPRTTLVSTLCPSDPSHL